MIEWFTSNPWHFYFGTWLVLIPIIPIFFAMAVFFKLIGLEDEDSHSIIEVISLVIGLFYNWWAASVAYDLGFFFLAGWIASAYVSSLLSKLEFKTKS